MIAGALRAAAAGLMGWAAWNGALLPASASAAETTNEASALVAKGKELGRYPRNFGIPVLQYRPGKTDAERRANQEAAGAAFEAALAIEPNNLEAKLYLADCLLFDVKEGEKADVSRPRDLLQDVALGTTNLEWIGQSAYRLAKTYFDKDDRRAVEILRAFADKAGPKHKFRLLEGALEPLKRLRQNDRVTEEEGLETFRACLVAECEEVMHASRTGQFVHFSGSKLNNTYTLLQRLLQFDKRGAEIYLEKFLPTVAEKYPGLAPHLWAAFVTWQSYEKVPQIAPSTISQLRIALKVWKKTPEKIVFADKLRQEFLGDLGAVFDFASLMQTLDNPENVPNEPSGPSVPARREIPRITVTTANTPLFFNLDKPLLSFCDFFVFAQDDDVLWMNDGILPVRYDKRSGKTTELKWPQQFNRPIRAIAVGSDTVWFGTAGNGLAAYTKKDGTLKCYGTNDGLLFSHISALSIDGNKLWIGYGTREVGGVGFLDLRTQKITSYPAPASSFIANRPGIESQELLPPRNAVSSLVMASTTDLWVAVPSVGLKHFRTGVEKWETVMPSFRPEALYSINASSNWLVYGGIGHHGGLVTVNMVTGVHRQIDGISDFLKSELDSPTMPNKVVYSTFIDGDSLWIGGLGYIAVVDLPSGQVKRIADLDDQSLKVRSICADRSSIWITCGRSLYQVPKKRAWIVKPGSEARRKSAEEEG